MKKYFLRLLSLLLSLLLIATACASAEDIPMLAENIETFHSLSDEEIDSFMQREALAKKVKSLAEACRASNPETDYAAALWMHDWLIQNADYDTSYTEYEPEGVLLRDKGVCQSYSLAYLLLLNQLDIECQYVVSASMNHSWNLVKLNGKWYHVDVTWDDPQGGGMENHAYFCLSDAYMKRDHEWIYSDYPAADDDSLNYSLNDPNVTPVDTEDAIKAAMDAAVAENSSSVTFYNASTGSFDLQTALDHWWQTYRWSYPFDSMTVSGAQYEKTLSFKIISGLTITNYTDTDALKSDLKEALSGRYTRIRVHDGTTAAFNDETLAELTMQLLHELSPNFGSVAESSYLLLSDDRSIEVSVSYLPQKNLPEPAATVSPVKNVSFSFSDCDGNLISNSTTNGKNTLFIFGSMACSNTNALLSTLYSCGGLLKASGAEVAVVLADASDSDALRAFADYYSGLRCAFTDANLNPVWDMLAEMNVSLGSPVHLPIVLMQNADGQLVYCSTGYVSEPMRLVSLLCGGSNAKVELPEDNCVLTLPKSLIQVEAGAFMNLTEINEVRFGGDSVTSIGANAFKGCSELLLISIPDSVTEIGSGAFSGCDKLTICAGKDSAAHAYALANDIRFIAAE